MAVLDECRHSNTVTSTCLSYTSAICVASAAFVGNPHTYQIFKRSGGIPFSLPPMNPGLQEQAVYTTQSLATHRLTTGHLFSTHGRVCWGTVLSWRLNMLLMFPKFMAWTITDRDQCQNLSFFAILCIPYVSSSCYRSAMI